MKKNSQKQLSIIEEVYSLDCREGHMEKIVCVALCQVKGQLKKQGGIGLKDFGRQGLKMKGLKKG